MHHCIHSISKKGDKVRIVHHPDDLASFAEKSLLKGIAKLN